VAVAAHTVEVWQTTWLGGSLNLSFFNAASLVGWMMSLLLLLLALPRRPVENLGIAILPLTGVAAFLSFYVGRPAAHTAPVADVDIHIFVSVLAYSILGLAAVQALLLAVQERQLRHRRPGHIIGALPPLQTMEEMLFSMLRLGFVLLTLALISGWLFVDNLFAQHLVHKTVLSIVAWLVFGTLLWGRHRFGWRGQTAMRWTLGGFATLMLAYFGSKLVLEFILRR